MEINVITNGKKNESTQKLFVKPVETVLAPKTEVFVTITEAFEVGVYPVDELKTETLLFSVVVPNEKFCAPATCVW